MATLPFLLSQDGDYRKGQKGAIVEFFGWPHAAVEQECAFLAQAGYLGAKLFPPQEQVMSTQPFQNNLNPWYFMYQPVSYRLTGRMGTRDELRTLIRTCRKLGVRVYADAVVRRVGGGRRGGKKGGGIRQRHTHNYKQKKEQPNPKLVVRHRLIHRATANSSSLPPPR